MSSLSVELGSQDVPITKDTLSLSKDLTQSHKHGNKCILNE